MWSRLGFPRRRLASMIRSTLATYAAQIAVVFTSFVTSVLLARYLGPADRGIAAIAVLTPSILVAIITPGYSTVIVPFMGHPTAKNQEVVAFVNATALAASAVSSLLYVPIALVAVSAVGAAPGTMALSWLLVPMSILNLGAAYLTIGLGKVSLRAMGAIAQAVAGLCLTWIALVGGLGPAAAVVGVAGGLVVSLGFLGLVVRRSVSLRSLRLPLGTARRMLAFGLRGQAGQVAQFLNYRLDSVILAVIAGPSAVGLYSVATSVAEGGGLIASAASTAAYPRFVRDTSSVWSVLAWTTLSTVLLVAGIAVLGPFAIPILFGGAFAPAITPMLVLLPGVIALAPLRVLSVATTAIGRPGLASLASVVGLCVTVGLDVALIPRAGAVGAGVASSVAYVVSAGMMIVTYRRAAATLRSDIQ